MTRIYQGRVCIARVPRRDGKRISGAGCGRVALRRVLWIHERLGNERRANAATLARELEVSARTVKRDIEYMRDELGAPIEWQSATQTYCYARECDILPLLRLDAGEALALMLAGRTFAAWRGSSLGRALTAALEKIAGVVGGAISLPASEISDLVFQPDEGPEADAEKRFFAVAIEAIRRRREMRLVYQKPGARQPGERTVHPLHLAFLDHRWVLVAFDPARSEPRKFLLARIKTARAGTKQFSPPADFDLRAYLGGSFGLFTGKKDWDVRVRFDEFAAPYIRERRWHPSQTIADRSGGGIEVALRLNNLIDVQRWVLGWGGHAEVLAPAELRNAVRREAAAMTALYPVPPSASVGPSPACLAEAGRRRADTLAPPPSVHPKSAKTYSQGQPVSHPPA